MTAPSENTFGPLPRCAPNAGRPGAYQLASRVFSNVVDRGGLLEIEQFVTGYGDIGDAKIFAYFPPSLFEPTSTITHSFKGKITGPTRIDAGWGNQTNSLKHENFLMIFAGIKFPTWPRETCFFDVANVGGAEPYIFSEQRSGGVAPVHYKLKVRPHVKPGEYFVDFHFTYFNGDKWTVAKETVRFKVRNVFEKYSTQVTALGVTAASFALLNGAIALGRTFIGWFGKG